jgi:hypothetical protein
MIKENLEAIALVKTIQAENRKPTSSEKSILSKFNGWGAMWQVFKPEHPQHEELKSLLTPEEFTKANASILNAHYTHPEIVKAVWESVKHLGFEFGFVLEPSCGTGYFMDRKIGHFRNTWTAVELDPIPAAIASYLHSGRIYNRGFERTDLPDGYFDMAIGNVPFGSYSVFEPRYDGLLIHNHFISKSVDLVREGGLIALITSTGTLDAEGNEDFRRSLSTKATLIAAIRMPGGTMCNAKTAVTTDLLILQKQPEQNAEWIETGEIYGLPINQYFLNNPTHVLGTVCKNKLYGHDTGLAVKADGRDVPAAIAKIIKSIEPCYKAGESIRNTHLIPTEFQDLPVNAFCRWNNQTWQRGEQRMESGSWSFRVAKNLGILTMVDELLDRQLNESDEQLAELRQKLNHEYDQFVKVCGLLSSDENKALMQSDPRYNLLHSLDAGGTKAQIFTRRTTRGYQIPKQCASAKDALLHCLNVKGRVDLNWIESRVSA